jgi:hypothetical protein
VTAPDHRAEAPRPPGQPGPPTQAMPTYQPPAGRAGVPAPPVPPIPAVAAPVAAPVAAGAPPRRPLGLLPLGVAGVALLLAIVATVVAIGASATAREARDLAAARSAAPAPDVAAGPSVEQPAGPAVPTEEPADPNATGEPVITERTTYTAHYDKEPLSLTANCGAMYADVDEPRGNVEASGADLLFEGECGNQPGHFGLGQEVNGSTAGSRDSTPADCVTKIRQSPVGTGNAIPARKGTVICVTTSYPAAKTRGDKWRVARLEVVDVSGDGTSAKLEGYAWDID